MSNLIKKSFLISMVVMTAMWGVAGVLNVATVSAAAPGDLIKSDSSPAVYYLDSNNTKHPFHHEREYWTWYDNFDGVMTVTTDEMVGYTLGSTVVVRPGSRLAQYVEVLGDGTWSVSNTPEVYAVGASGALHHLDSAETAVELYGSNWESMIVPLPNYLAANYGSGADLTSGSMYPTGTLVKTAAEDQVYYVDGDTIRPVTDDGFTGNRFNMDYIVTAADLSAYTEGSSVTGYEAGVADPVAGAAVVGGTGLTVALASSTPGAQVAPISATNVPLMKFNVTASSDGAITVSSIKVKRNGVGDTNDFAYLYLYDGATRLTNGKTINSSSHEMQFTGLGLTINAGQTRTLTLSADVQTVAGGATSGNVHYFTVESAYVETTATVNGSFPVMSNTTTIGSSVAGSLVVYKNGSLANPSVGQQNSKFAQFKLTAGSGENLNVNRITLYQSGTINNNYVTNLKLYQSTTLLAEDAAIDSSGYIVFDMSSSPYNLAKNTSGIFYVTGDISTSAKNGDTIITYVDQTTDVYAVGDTFGYGSSVDIGATSGTYDGSSSGEKYSTVTVQGGQITVAMNGPVAGNLAKGATDAVLMNFSITSGVNAEIRSMRVELHKTGTDLDTDDNSDCEAGTDYITNVKVVDTDNGESTSATDCGSFSEINGSNNGLQKTYTDYFTLTAGETRNFAIKADLSSSLTAGTYYAVLGSSSTTYYTFSSTAIKNNDNNQWVTDIVPTSQSTGNNMTVAAARLGVALQSNAVEETIVQGTNNVELLKMAFNADQGSNVTMTSLALTGYIATTSPTGAGSVQSGTSCTTGAGRTYCINMAGNVFSYVNNIVSNLRIYDTTDDPSKTTNLNSTIEDLSSAAGVATFDNMNWEIPAGETHVLTVVGDVSNTAYANGANGDKYVKLNIAAATDVTALDASNNEVTLTDDDWTDYAIADVNGAATTMASSYYIKATNAGTLNITYEDNPAEANVVANSSDVPMLRLKFDAQNEAFNVNKFQVFQSNTASTTYNRAVQSCTVSYQNQAGEAKTATQSAINGNCNFNITSVPIYVPATTDKYVDVYFNLSPINNNLGAYTSDKIAATFHFNANFEARGVGSSNTSLTATSNGANQAGNNMYVHGALLTITPDTTTSTALSNAPVELYRFAASAQEGGNSVSLKKISFKLSMSDVTISASTLYLSNFTIHEGSSYSGVAGLTSGDTGTNAYAIYNEYGWSTTTAAAATNTTAIQNRDAAGGGAKLSSTDSRMYHNIAGQGINAASASSTHWAILVFNDDRNIPAGGTKYYILKADAQNVDSGGVSQDSMTVYITDSDTATSTGKYIDLCDHSPAQMAGKYCLAERNRNGYDTTQNAAWQEATHMIWSDNTGTAGNGTHSDVDELTDATSSTDWFNGYKIKTLNSVRSLQ